MNGVNILKITKEMWLEIENGNKHIDVRKLNKDYIQVMNDIIFVDVRTFEHYGQRRCIGKLYQKPNDIGYLINHQPTIDYVNKNYIKEPLLIVFTLGD